ncbi:hypothetical protein CSAL01_12561 [Colletotrichum salicis]|uniref:Uncharacterized protein n=1 Tax=Colletotrichum salicis TaxID=1209931 RepID=A0A135UXV2_9PEZI|nr:hypothetical protein CSAL01_12561 [Colletotrichum salicis]
MSQSSHEIQAKDIVSVNDVLQLAERSKLLATSTHQIMGKDMDEVEQILRPDIVAVLDCILKEIPKNITPEQDNTTKGLDESTDAFNLEDIPDIVERFKKLILRFEVIDRLANQLEYDALAEQQPVEACVEAGRLQVLMGRVFDAIVSDARKRLPSRTSTHTVRLTIYRGKSVRRPKGEGRPPPRLDRQDATVGQGGHEPPRLARENADVGQGTDASEILKQKGENPLAFKRC